MLWNYLTQFWDQIVAVGEYPITFFQNIGNAVAGAIGSFLDIIFHNLNDIFVFVAWFGTNIKSIFLSLLSPITYFFNVLKFFYANAFASPLPAEATYTFTEPVLSVFNTIPYWNVISSVIGAVLIFIIGLSAIKLLLRA